jgi:hypothetical protein
MTTTKYDEVVEASPEQEAASETRGVVTVAEPRATTVAEAEAAGEYEVVRGEATTVAEAEAAVEYEVVRDDAIQIWPSPRAPEPFRRPSEDFVLYVPCALVWAFPRPLFEREGAEIREEGDGALVVYTDMAFPIAMTGAGL